MFCTAPASASTVTTGATPDWPPADVTSDGTLIVIPLDGNTPREHASIAGVPKRVFVGNSDRYWVGLNAGFVENESSAAVT